jgi:hypothetical protein
MHTRRIDGKFVRPRVPTRRMDQRRIDAGVRHLAQEFVRAVV